MAETTSSTAAVAPAAPVINNPLSARMEALKEELTAGINQGIITKRLVIMVGAADFFGKRDGRLRANPYELIALVNYLKSINAHQPADENEVTEVLAFDSNYTTESIYNDQRNLNWSIYLSRKGKGLTKDTYEEDIDENPNEYLQGGNLGNIFFHFNFFDLDTRYKKFTNELKYYPYLNGKTTVKTMADQCVPQEGSVMKEFQDLIKQVSFQEYYLYNCAWIGGTVMIVNTNGKVRGSTAKQNRHYELMCELLYIFQNLGKPAYLLTAKDMSVYEHTGKIVGAPHNSLNVTPLNATTLFKKEEWRMLKGGTRKVRKTRKRKHSRKH
jgi:hypothetical protein